MKVLPEPCSPAHRKTSSQGKRPALRKFPAFVEDNELRNFVFPLSLIGKKRFQLRSHHGIEKSVLEIAWLILRKPDLHRQRNGARTKPLSMPGDSTRGVIR